MRRRGCATAGPSAARDLPSGAPPKARHRFAAAAPARPERFHAELPRGNEAGARLPALRLPRANPFGAAVLERNLSYCIAAETGYRGFHD
jgi:hypothetical protein